MRFMCLQPWFITRLHFPDDDPPYALVEYSIDGVIMYT